MTSNNQSIDTDTIAAVATATGNAGIGIVRISGSKALAIAKQICQLEPQPRNAHFTAFYRHGVVLDQGICLYFQAPHSFTGEDIIEFQAHGGAVLLSLLLNEVLSLGARQARPGEFSQRAFLNDKIDLTQAEAIADLIEANSESAARNAINTLQGKFSQKINHLVQEVIALRVYVEAAIDFPEEEIDFLQDDYIANSFLEIKQQLQLIIAQAKQGSLLKEGIKAVIIGKPNAGKSSLLNALTEKDSAIVTPIQGTTRDVLREHILIDDLPVHIIDTAGLRQSTDLVEQEGIRRASEEAKYADVIIVVNDISEGLNQELDVLLKSFPAIDLLKHPGAKIIVQNKSDLINKQLTATTTQIDNNTIEIVYLSAKQRQGIDNLKQIIKRIVQYQPLADTQEGLFSARQRHQQALAKALDYLLIGQEQLNQHQAGELVAEDLRQCQYALSEITGDYSPDDLLGEIFSSFCIGK